ncbi:hypothetical protein [Ectothiorhodospira variabilis]|uniref:hypothetical protein n=1 Tax=Ectothiorhodospira variabilis TaxID=505694 RepID=UPI001EFA6B11|nr:hypothetical protein [Ectothiorhodospira variabilis]MCG5498960.1 hypothetical protein [Ectothiorhodospira variabilis]
MGCYTPAMNSFPDDDPRIPGQATLQADLERYERLIFELMTQEDLDGLYALYDRWVEQFGDSPRAIALCNALDDFIEVCIEDSGKGDPAVEQAYLDLVATVQQGKR